MINNLTISKDNISLCYKDNCVNFKGDLAKVLIVSIAFIVVIGAIASLVESSK